MTTDLEALCERLAITVDAVSDGSATLRMGDKTLTVPVIMGSNASVADIVAGIALDARAADMPPSEFMVEAGSGLSTRAALRMHERCRKLAPRVRDFLGESFDLLADAQH